jgi:5-methylcytosine-specific restriction protein A
VRNAQAEHNSALVAAWRNVHGDWCPGWGVPAHAATDLTAAHSVPLAAGVVTLADSVLCRACNTRQGTRPRMGGG